MEKVTRNYVIAALAVMIIAFVEYFTRSADLVFIVFPIIMTVTLYPVAVLGLYMFLEARGYRYVNGIEWDRFTETQKTTMASYIGLFIAVGIAVLSYGVLFLSSGNFVAGILFLILGIVGIMIPILMKGRFMDRNPIRFGRKGKIGTFVVFSILIMAPFMAIGAGEMSSQAVSVEIGDQYLVIKAPMVNETFEYGLIKDMTYDPEFDKGYRVMGYGTLTIKSGTFHNDAFGNYTLASFAQVKPCVFFQYEGNYYAFNQSDDAKTLAAFEAIKDKIDSIKN